jgi:drug/metabolite transporter (DMT)-like permease
LKVSLATILFFLHPIYTYFITAFILKKKIAIRKWFALLVSLIGIAFVVDITNLSMADSGKGMIFAVIAGLCYSIFTVNNEVNKDQTSGYTTTLYTITFSGLTMGVLASTQLNNWLAFNFNQLKVITGISLIGTILGILCFVVGIKLVGATTASVVSVFEPLSGVFLAYIFLDETISFVQSIGIMIVLVAVYLVTTKRKLAIKN